MDTDRFCRKLGKKGLFQVQGYQATGNVWEKDKKNTQLSSIRILKSFFLSVLGLKAEDFGKLLNLVTCS